MNKLKNSVLFSKIKCPFCSRELMHSDLNLYPDDGIIIHSNSSNNKCKKIFPVINGIILLSDYRYWPENHFSLYLSRNKERLHGDYLNYLSNVLNKIKRKGYKFENEKKKKEYDFIKFQQNFVNYNYNSITYKDCTLPNGYISNLIKGSRINKFVDEYTKIKHCKKSNFYSGEWILTICTGDGKDVLILNKYLYNKGIRLNNVLTDISFNALLESKKKFLYLSAYYILSNSHELPFYDNSFDVCYVHAGLHHLPNTPDALVNLGKKTKRLLFVAEAQKNKILKFLKLQKPEIGGVEYRFTKKEIMKLIGPNFRKIKIQTAFIYNKPTLQRIFNKIDFLIVYILFKTAFIIVNLIIGRYGNSMLISALKKKD